MVTYSASAKQQRRSLYCGASQPSVSLCIFIFSVVVRDSLDSGIGTAFTPVKCLHSGSEVVERPNTLGGFKARESCAAWQAL